jgi:steroid delta-isomerase-like uncharacterized protein
MSDEHKKIARKFLEDGWNKGKEKAIDELMSPKCRFHDPVFPSLTSGMENYKEHIRNCRNGFPDLKFTIEDSIAERNEVVHHWKAHGTHGGAFLGMPATNKSATVSGTTIYRMERGKVAEIWVDWNLLSLLEQLGLAMPQMMQSEQPAGAQR